MLIYKESVNEAGLSALVAQAFEFECVERLVEAVTERDVVLDVVADSGVGVLCLIICVLV